MRILLILLGGAIGTLTRFGVSGFAHQKFIGTFPVGTLAVNLMGSFLIGFLWGVAENSTISPNARLFLFVGILGGFTTFSAFSLETLSLLRTGDYKFALINILLNNVLGILLAFAGLMLAKYFR